MNKYFVIDMRRICGLLIMAFFITTIAAADETTRLVNAPEGLNMRAAPSTTGKVLALVPNGAEVKVLEESGDALTIQGASGKWTRVEWNGRRGWVFGGFLKISQSSGRTKSMSDYPNIIAAAKDDNISAVRQFIESGANVNLKIEYQPAIRWALENNNVTMAKLLLEAGANPDTTFNWSDQPIIMLASSDTSLLEIVKILIKKGANVNATDFHRWTALNYACDEGNLEIVKVLLEAGADPNTQNNNVGGFPLFDAVTNNGANTRGIVKLLVEHGADVNKTGYLNNGSEDTMTTLFIACVLNNSEVTRFLLDSGANPDVVDKNQKRNALQYMIIGANIADSANDQKTAQTIKALIEHGIDINHQDDEGKTALHYAYYFGYAKTAQQLIAAKANTAIRDNENKSASDYEQNISPNGKKIGLLSNAEYPTFSNLMFFADGRYVEKGYMTLQTGNWRINGDTITIVIKKRQELKEVNDSTKAPEGKNRYEFIYKDVHVEATFSWVDILKRIRNYPQPEVGIFKIDESDYFFLLEPTAETIEFYKNEGSFSKVKK